jgi:hypothetical protein
MLLVPPLAFSAACSTKSGTADPAPTAGSSGVSGAITGASGASGSTGSGTGGASAGFGGAGGTSTVTGGGTVAGDAKAEAGGASAIGDASADISVGSGGGPNDAGSDAPIIAVFADEALKIAGNYKSWGRVDDELRWAPFLCRIPLPGSPHVSHSNDPATHGQKLYSVFAKNNANYPNGPHTDQVVVKESWVPEVVTTPDASYNPNSYYQTDGGNRATIDADHFYGYAKGEGGVVYRAGTPAGLFIMFKLAETTPDTDQGWVYATVTTGGEVTSAGRVATCMGCHESADHERLFGVPETNSR